MQDEGFRKRPSSVSHEASGLRSLQIQTSVIPNTKLTFKVSEASVSSLNRLLTKMREIREILKCTRQWIIADYFIFLP